MLTESSIYLNSTFSKSRNTTSITGWWELFSNYKDQAISINSTVVEMDNLIIYNDGTYEMGEYPGSMYSGVYSLIHDGTTINLYKGYSPSHDFNLDVSFIAEGIMELSFQDGSSVMYVAS